MTKTALITGVTGQDGSYLAELLLGKGYTVHGLIRRSSSFNTERLDTIYEEPQAPDRRLVLHYGDLTEGTGLVNLLREIQPDEVYNLGAQSHVRVSFQTPLYTADSAGVGALRLLEALRAAGTNARFVQASSSEMFGSSPPPQNEDTPFHPRSPYAVAKVFAHYSGVNYREAHGMFCANAIMFNHESPRRGETFVTRKITRAVARIEAGLQSKLYLGNLAAARDWGYAPEYVEGMWRMLQLDHPEDIVFATGEMRTVAEFCELAFGGAGLDWRDFVEHDPIYDRAAEVHALRGDAAKAQALLDWQPQVRVERLARIMLDADMRLVDHQLRGGGVRIDRA